MANARHRPGSEKITEQMVKNLWKRQEGKCALTGQTMLIGDKWFQPSLDRIDPERGYLESNIRLTCWIVNHVKGDLIDLEFIKLCTAVSLHNNLVYTGVM